MLLQSLSFKEGSLTAFSNRTSPPSTSKELRSPSSIFKPALGKETLPKFNNFLPTNTDMEGNGVSKILFKAS